MNIHNKEETDRFIMITGLVSLLMTKNKDGKMIIKTSFPDKFEDIIIASSNLSMFNLKEVMEELDKILK